MAVFAQAWQVVFVFAIMNQICSFRPLEVSGPLSQLDVVPLRAVLVLVRVKIGEPADFSVGSNVSFVSFPVDLGVLNRRGSVGSPVFAAPLALAMFLEGREYHLLPQRHGRRRGFSSGGSSTSPLWCASHN